MRKFRSSVTKLRTLLKMLSLLANGHATCGADLAELLGVSRRTVLRYVKSLQQAGIDVCYDEVRERYRIVDAPRLRLRKADAVDTGLALAVARACCHHPSGIPGLRRAAYAAHELILQLTGVNKDVANTIAESLIIRLSGDHVSARGAEHIHPLLTARVNQRRIRVTLVREAQRAQSGMSRTLLAPYQLIFSHGQWVVYGRSSLHRRRTTIRLCDIESVELTEDRFEVPPQVDIHRTVLNGDELRARAGTIGLDQRVVLVFQSRSVSRAMKRDWSKNPTWKPLNGGAMELHLEVGDLESLVPDILGFGTDVLVLKPVSLRELVLMSVRSVVKHHNRHCQ
ncbi:MAG: WYL domain-containing transcriptional regulator [Planctomycetaceae bacterium]|nr:WYL domain-containing transcriptional regulator [Planctomycetaceae bacterium]